MLADTIWVALAVASVIEVFESTYGKTVQCLEVTKVSLLSSVPVKLFLGGTGCGQWDRSL